MTDKTKLELKEFMLTTTDNPFNPFIQFDEWNNFDMSKGYNTCAFLGRVVANSPDLSEADQSYNIDEAMSRIVDLDPFNLYRKIDESGNYEYVDK